MQHNAAPVSTPPINIAVVGHTNAGKTSLLRTLLRDDRFGKVDEVAGTTRAVEKSSIYAGDDEILTLFDTPGFEDSSALLQVIENLSGTMPDASPVAVLRALLAQADHYPEFAQEIKVLRQALRSEVLLYMIDVREPLLGKYRDEVEILGMAGKPILPVFNFIAGHAEGLARWREQMARFNLHAALEFDTVAFEFEAEKRLYQKLQSLYEQRYDDLQKLIEYRQDVWNRLLVAAAHRIFQLLAEVACFRREVGSNGMNDPGDVASIQDFVRNAERLALKDLLKMFAFTRLDIELQQLPVRDGRWELDIFSPHMLKEFGLNTGVTALSGAAMGAGIDLMVGGMSLGAAALLGAVLGAGWGTMRRFRDELTAVLRGHRWLCVDEDTVSLLYLRQRWLLRTLTTRGHAARDRLQLSNDQRDDRQLSLPHDWRKVIKELRQNPQWQQAPASDPEYLKLQAQVTGWLSM
jgi:hypothetical protein